jgi:N-acetylmuramoyl-L-alanine amidase
MAFLVLGAVLYFAISAALGGEDAPPAGGSVATGVDVGNLRIYHDHAALNYAIHYNDPNQTFRIFDPEGFVNDTIFNPRNRTISLHTDLPIIVDIRNGEGDYTHVHVISPREFYDRIIVIDPGHGGADQGAPAPGGALESQIVLEISLLLYDLFEQSNSGIRAFMTRFDDDFVTLARRSRFANGVGHLFVSIHTNTYADPAVAGTETLYNPASNPLNAAFAQIIQDGLVAELGTRDRGIINRQDLYVLNTTTIPAAVVEVDFKTNPQALINLQNREYQQRVAEALYQAIVEAAARLDISQ